MSPRWYNQPISHPPFLPDVDYLPGFPMIILCKNVLVYHELSDSNSHMFNF
jgi:hypothetical protein